MLRMLCINLKDIIHFINLFLNLFVHIFTQLFPFPQLSLVAVKLPSSGPEYMQM